MGIRYDPPAKNDKMRTHCIEKLGQQPPEPPDSGNSHAPSGLFTEVNPGDDRQEQAQPPDDRPADHIDLDAGGASSGGMGGDYPDIPETDDRSDPDRF